MAMEKIYISIPYDDGSMCDMLKETAFLYCSDVNNLIHKSIITKNNEEYTRIVNNYIKDVDLVKINISNLIIGNYIINYVKYNNKLISKKEFNMISNIANKITSDIQIYTEKQITNSNNNILLFLFFDNRLMFNIF